MYVIDTSSLINLHRYYRPSTFRTVWDRIERLMRAGQLIAPHEVKREIENGHDGLVAWAKSATGLFVEMDNEQAGVIASIHQQFPNFINLLKPGVDADPWCVALAVVRSRQDGATRWTVINEEKQEKMPTVCAGLNVGSTKLLDFFDALGGF